MAPKKTSARAAARKIKDKWRSKNWYRVLAPDMFESVQIGETLADAPDKLKGRVLDVTLQQLTGDFSKMHIKLHFKIDTVSGSDAFSNFIGHSLTSDYIRRLTRRKRSKMDGIYNVMTKDGFTVRVKPFAVTEKRIQTSQQYAIRMKMKSVIETQASSKLVSEFIREMLSGDLSSRIFKECKPIYPIKRVEIRRSEIIGIPSHGTEMVLPEQIVQEDTDVTAGVKDQTAEVGDVAQPEEPVPVKTEAEAVDKSEPAEKKSKKPESAKVAKTTIKKDTKKKTTTKAKKEKESAKEE